MALQATVENLEAVAEPLREHYKQGEDGKFHLAAEGVEDVTGLKKALQAERDNAKKLGETLHQFDGVDLKAYKDWASRMENDEEMKLLRDGRADELRARWTGKMQEAHQREVEKLAAQHKKELAAIETRAKQYEDRVLENALRAATIEVEGFHKPATRDAIREGRGVFTLDEHGNAVKKDPNTGQPVYGKDGRLYQPKEWLEEQRTESPHWFAASGSGTGTQQSGVMMGNSGRKQVTRETYDRMSPEEKHQFVVKEKGRIIDVRQ